MNRYGRRLTPDQVARIRRARNLGDLPDDLSLERIARPPILNAKEFNLEDQAARALEARLPHWHMQDLTNYMVQIGLVSTQISPSNKRRAYVILINDSANVIRIAFGHDADLVSGIPLLAGGGFFEPILGTVSSIAGITTVAAQNLLVCEGQYVS